MKYILSDETLRSFLEQIRNETFQACTKIKKQRYPRGLTFNDFKNQVEKAISNYVDNTESQAKLFNTETAINVINDIRLILSSNIIRNYYDKWIS